MKRVGILLALVACAGVALAADPLQSTQNLTGTAPSTATDGMPMAGVRAFRVSICATSGQTLSGAGTLQAYWYDPVAALWMRNPLLDLSVTATTRCQVFPDQRVTAAGAGRVFYVTSSVTVSGGTTVVTRIYPSAIQP